MAGDIRLVSSVEPWDFVVVGAGAAGSILAARLSEDPSCRVLLVEAGRDTPPDDVPADIRDVYPVSYSNPSYFWEGLTAAHGAGGHQAAAFLQPRVMGGGSSVMGMWAVRGLPDDYDGWAQAGAAGWGWNDVLPFFNKLENDLDFQGPLHGSSGALPVRRTPLEQWPAFASALLKAGERRGLKYHDDLNAEFDDGIYPMPIANTAAGRVTAPDIYLNAETRRRANLHIATQTIAQRVLFNGRRAEAVVLRGVLGTQTVRARRIVISAGAIFSPALLLRSGVGPAEELRASGVTPVADLPVGKGLQNHCVVNLATVLPRFARQAKALRTYGLACARVSSGLEGAPRGDLMLQIVANTSPQAHGDRIGILGAALYAPMSKGTVTLDAADPGRLPKVDFRLMDHPLDRARITKALAVSLELLSDPAVMAVRGDVVAISNSSFVRRLNRPGLVNRALSASLAGLLDAPWPFSLIWQRAGRPVDVDDLSSTQLDALRDLATPIFHPTGTCRMGAANDPAAVVDPACRVRGLEDLHVVDASIMPRIPRANTCIPTMMVAERAADLILRGA